MDTTALSYNDIMEQIKQVPQECLPEISNYIGYVIYVNSRKEEATPKANLRHKARIDELAALKSNWDDDNALPIEKQTIKNARVLIDKANEADLKDWVIFPDTNGTILLENKTNDATISLGNKSFSFISKSLRGSNQKYSVSALLNTIRTING